MPTCKLCLSDISESNPALTAEFLEAELGKRWWKADTDDDYGWPIGMTIDLSDGRQAEVVAKKVEFSPAHGDVGDRWGSELSQGTTFETYIIFRVGEEFYRKTGEGDSYCDITWGGPVYPVVVRQKVVTSYDLA